MWTLGDFRFLAATLGPAARQRRQRGVSRAGHAPIAAIRILSRPSGRADRGAGRRDTAHDRRRCPGSAGRRRPRRRARAARPRPEALAAQRAIAIAVTGSRRSAICGSVSARRAVAGDYASLQALAGLAEGQSRPRRTLVGHTDASGGLAANIALSRERAASVIETAGEKLRRAARPARRRGAWAIWRRAPSNLTEAGRAKNRRVEAIVSVGELGGGCRRAVLKLPQL